MPPTQIYNEGWMLRIILDWFAKHSGNDHILSFPGDGRWYSEALLASPFLSQVRGDPLGESYTHADGVIGHFEIGNNGYGDLLLRSGATHFIIIEAKMFSKLSPGVTHARYYNQAARNVACISEILNKAHCNPRSLTSLGFCLIAPESRIDEGIFTQYMSPVSIKRTVKRRVEEYNGTKDEWYHNWFLPTMEAIKINTISWEQVIADISAMDAVSGKELEAFYNLCLKYNKVTSEHYFLCHE